MIDDLRVQVLAHHLQRVLELDEPAQREVLGLDRHDHAGRGDERVDRQQAERRRRVDQDVVVALRDVRERLLQRALAADLARERHVGAGQVDRRDGDVDLALGDHLADRGAVHEHVEHRPLDRVRVHPLRHRQVSLRVEVDAEHAHPLLGQRDAQVERRRRLGDAALLVREGDHLRSRRGFHLRGVAQGGAREQACDCHLAILSRRARAFLHGYSADERERRHLPHLRHALTEPTAAARARASPSALAHSSASATSSRSSSSSTPDGSVAVVQLPDPLETIEHPFCFVHAPTVPPEPVTCLCQLRAEIVT